MLFEFLLDPNIIYAALVLGLWLGVTSVYIPGTGIPEVLAVIMTFGSFILLTMMPTNWIAVLLLVVGAATFLVMPFAGKRYGQFAELGLILQGLGGYLLFDGLAVSPLLIVVTLVLAVIYNRAILAPTIENVRSHNEYDHSNEVIGIIGRVVKELNPVGTVYVGKELWRARSTERLEVDTPIVVRTQNGLELEVEKAKREDIAEANLKKDRVSNS